MKTSVNLNKIISRISVDISDSILSTLKKMDSLGMKLLVVNDKGSFRSLVSIGDIQRAIIKGIDLQEKIEGILRDQITVCYEGQSEESIKDTMMLHRVEFMPIIDEKNSIRRIIFWDDIIHDNAASAVKELDAAVVIMAGGKGTRLRPLTNIIPKPLIPVGDKPIIEMIINSFRRYGMRDFHLIVNYKASMIETYMSEISDKDYQINIVREKSEFGTGGSLTMLRGKIGKTFFVTNCDTLLDQDLNEVYKFHRENNNELTIIGALKHYSIPYGMIEFQEGGKFLGIAEKPELTLTVNSGTYLLEPHLLNEIPEDEFFHVTELIARIKERKGRVGVFPVSEKSWLDIGEWAEYSKTQEFLSKRNKY
jgi:dTDP-glucose pyrophosphorylase